MIKLNLLFYIYIPFFELILLGYIYKYNNRYQNILFYWINQNRIQNEINNIIIDIYVNKFFLFLKKYVNKLQYYFIFYIKKNLYITLSTIIS